MRWSEIGVLTRDNAHAEEVFDALTGAGIPVEIVGLSGLLRLPEVAEIVAILHLLHDVTANASLLTLLTGPRWAIGPRDLRLLEPAGPRARRARRAAARRRRRSPTTWSQIADGIDPAEIPCLDDALGDPGDARRTPPRRWSGSRCSRASCGCCARHVGEPLLDIVRRIIDTSGADVELASAVSPAAAARRDNLDLFVRAVADFQAVDGDVTLPALLAYLTAEDDQGNGLDVATPTAADSVKLLTVHRSKGLEWGSVFLVGVCETRFPANRSRTLWTSSPAVLPAPLRGDAADLPQLRGYDKAALDAYRADTRAHDATEELRLGYVAFTRAAHRLSVTSYFWSPRATPFGPSAYQERRARPAATSGASRSTAGSTSRRRATPTRTPPRTRRGPGRPTGTGARGARCGSRRPSWCAPSTPAAEDHGLDMIEPPGSPSGTPSSSGCSSRRAASAAPTSPCRCPAACRRPRWAGCRTTPRRSPASWPGRCRGRRRRRRGSAPCFHAWVEDRFGQQALFDTATCPAAPTPASTTTPTSRS